MHSRLPRIISQDPSDHDDFLPLRKPTIFASQKSFDARSFGLSRGRGKV